MRDLNLFHAILLKKYWDYFPQNVQVFLASSIRAKVVAAKSLHDEFKNIDSSITEMIESSLFSLEKAVETAIKQSKDMPKFYIPESMISREVTDTSLVSNNRKTLPTKRNKKYTLEELVSKITPENSHEATDWGDPVGEEAW